MSLVQFAGARLSNARLCVAEVSAKGSVFVMMAFGKRYAEPAVYRKNGSFAELQNSYRWMCDPDLTLVSVASLLCSHVAIVVLLAPALALG